MVRLSALIISAFAMTARTEQRGATLEITGPVDGQSSEIFVDANGDLHIQPGPGQKLFLDGRDVAERLATLEATVVGLLDTVKMITPPLVPPPRPPPPPSTPPPPLSPPNLPPLAPGEALYTTVGSFTWTAPMGVTIVSVVLVGGGGGGVHNRGAGGGGGALAWMNGFSVVPGTGYPFVVGAGGIDNQEDGTGLAGNGGTSSAFGCEAMGGYGGNALGNSGGTNPSGSGVGGHGGRCHGCGGGTNHGEGSGGYGGPDGGGGGGGAGGYGGQGGMGGGPVGWNGATNVVNGYAGSGGGGGGSTGCGQEGALYGGRACP